MCPYGVQVNVIEPGVKEHIDLSYFATPEGTIELKISEREAYALGWYTVEEIKKLDTFPSVIQWCEFFYNKNCNY